jgi:hypothetical protein
MNISLDSYCDHTLREPSEELMEYFTLMMDDVDLLFYGRVIYQLMFPYWADVAKDRTGSAAEIRFAERLVYIDNCLAMSKKTLSLSMEVNIGLLSIPSNIHAVDKPVPVPNSSILPPGLVPTKVLNKEQVLGSDAIVKPEYFVAS